MPDVTLWCLKCGVAVVWATHQERPEQCGNPDCQAVNLWTTLCPFLIPAASRAWELTEKDRRLLKALHITPE